MKAYLILEDDTVYEGTHIGAQRERVSVLCANTAMVGHTGILTDPAYAGCALVMTYPLIGNAGINRADMVSERIWADALIVRELSRIPSNFRSELFIQDFLLEYGIPGIEGVDTRAIARKLREKGPMKCLITTNDRFDRDEVKRTLRDHRTDHPVNETMLRSMQTHRAQGKEEKGTVGVLDFGLRNDLKEALNEAGFTLIQYPGDTKAKDILADDPDGILVSGGPGDPAGLGDAAKEVVSLAKAGKPFLATGLGHQLLAVGAGAKTGAMLFGHHGCNYPVRCLADNRVRICTEHCSHTVDEASLEGSGLKVTHVNVNDGTVEGLHLEGSDSYSVQFYPDPAEKTGVLQTFMDMMTESGAK